MFNALLLEKGDDDKVTYVTVDVAYSTLNYKDGLVLGGLGGLVRNYPHVPGIDFSGTVRESSHKDYQRGDKVVCADRLARGRSTLGWLFSARSR